MKFFTRELYQRFNSEDDNEADQADAEWEVAIAGYRAHLDSLRNQVPVAVRGLLELCLHDAEVLAIQQTDVPAIFPTNELPHGIWTKVASLFLRHNQQLQVMTYLLWDGVRESPAPVDWKFSKLCKHVLYDEFDAMPGSKGEFLHRILFSDGSVQEIPFVTVVMQGTQIPSEPSRQIA